MNSISTDEEKIIRKCIDNSYETKPITQSYPSTWLSNKISNFKNNLKYNIIRFYSNFNIRSNNAHIFNKTYNTVKDKNFEKIKRKINKIIYISYRSQYRPQINIKNNSIYSSDCGWGCMIRSSQMILARAIYKIIKFNNKIKENEMEIINNTILFFMEYNLNIKEIKSNYLDSYINKLSSIVKQRDNKEEIISIDPPFSIHKICTLGEIYGRTCGEWFSDFELPKIYKIINSSFDIFPNLKIFHFNSNIELNTIVHSCLKESPNSNISNYSNEDIFVYNNTKFLFENMGLIFVSVRLGLYYITPEYIPSLKNLFSCKENIGFIGGRVNSAAYFIGYENNNLIFIDPHKNQTSLKGISELNRQGIATYLDKKIYVLSFSHLRPALTIGFLFRNLNEFKDLVEYFYKVKKEQYGCFYIQNLSLEKGIIEDFKDEGKSSVNEKDDF